MVWCTAQIPNKSKCIHDIIFAPNNLSSLNSMGEKRIYSILKQNSEVKSIQEEGSRQTLLCKIYYLNNLYLYCDGTAKKKFSLVWPHRAEFLHMQQLKSLHRAGWPPRQAVVWHSPLNSQLQILLNKWLYHRLTQPEIKGNKECKHCIYKD